MRRRSFFCWLGWHEWDTIRDERGHRTFCRQCGLLRDAEGEISRG